jgi:hypothetical protein
MVLTGNHHGIDTFADSVQATLLFGLWQRNLLRRPITVVVLACSSVTLSNATYPTGIRLYNAGTGPVDDVPRRVRLLPASSRSSMISTARPFTPEMAERVSDTVRTLGSPGALSQKHVAAARQFAKEVLSDSTILAMPTYLDQARAVNGVLWKKLFSREAAAPELVFLDLETICTQLVRLDLFKPNSLLAQLFTTRFGQRALLSRLDGTSGCWKSSALSLKAASAHIRACKINWQRLALSGKSQELGKEGLSEPADGILGRFFKSVSFGQHRSLRKTCVQRLYVRAPMRTIRIGILY